MSLRDINIKTEYRSLADNVARDFYIPLLKEANVYSRAVGFFSSSALVSITPGLYNFVKNNGKIRLVASPKLSEADIEAIKSGYVDRYAKIEEVLLSDILEQIDAVKNDRMNLLANLIANKILDIKIAVTKTCGMYHEKLGIIQDIEDNAVVFSGSMNESYVAMQQNYEAVDVYCSWKEHDAERVEVKRRAFETIWEGNDPHIDVVDFPNLKEEFIKKYKETDLEEALEKIKILEEESLILDNPITDKHLIQERRSTYDEQRFVKPDSIELYDYQLEAIENWKANGYRGIFDMATGTGKTLTGLSAIAELTKNVNRLAVFIVCPFQHLVEQWCEDIRRFNVEPVICYSSSEQKDYKERVKYNCFSFNFYDKNFICIITTNATFISKFMQKEIKILDGTDCLLLVDEAHNFGSKKLMKTLEIDFSYRLALSATLERHNDETGTEALKKFFGEKCIEYDLERAIKEEKLTPYYYYPIIVNLSEDELDKYQKLSAEIAKCIIVRNGKKELSDKGKRLAIIRARIVAGAINKIPALKDIIQDKYIDRHNMLIYCGATTLMEQDADDIDIEGDIRQIDYISRMLNFDLEIRTAQFTSKESAVERERRIQEFTDKEIQALVAIKCLDEGVNIPQIETAFILASTTNPKEYIQRRGRVLRKSKGKEYAVIYDFITLPRALDDVGWISENESGADTSLVMKELLRMNEFKRLAINSYKSNEIMYEIIDAYKLYAFELVLSGEEMEEDDLWLK